MTIVIGLCGAAGCGKSTFADILVTKYGFTRVKMAGPLKTMLRAIGLGDREIEGDLKEVPCALLCGTTPRHAMVTLGTEWGRDLISPDLWTTAWAYSVERAIAGGAIGVVSDDIRFPNEAEAIHGIGGSTIRLIGRTGVAASSGHASEQGAFEVDAQINNAGTVADLEKKVDGIMKFLLSKEEADHAR